MAGHLEALTRASEIERRAGNFSDPIARLRYLREATAAPAPPPSRRHWIVFAAIAVALLTCRSDALVRRPTASPKSSPQLMRSASGVPNIWPVEQTPDHDLYSNGLRIENALAVGNQPRSYRLIARDSGLPGGLRTQPAGIVFHTSESDQAPFEREQRSALTRIGRELLIYVRGHRAYHFVIDRFGRVHRIVAESDAANHAGHSIWADSKWTYLDLNDAFLGVAFEAASQAGQPLITDGQLRSARALTDVLRSHYNLAPGNCVVHAQVSVNPANHLIGWHTDWGKGFPFHDLGLPDNYRIPNPSLYLFGFEYDPPYIAITGPELWEGLHSAETQFHAAADAQGISPAAYKKVLQQRFRDALSAVQDKNADEENENE